MQEHFLALFVDKPDQTTVSKSSPTRVESPGLLFFFLLFLHQMTVTCMQESRVSHIASRKISKNIVNCILITNTC